MEQKKHNKVNLEQKRGVYAAIGLLLALAIVLTAFEYRMIKQYEKPHTSSNWDNSDIEIEVIPIYRPKVPEKPKINIEKKLTQTFIIDDPVEEDPIDILPLDIPKEENLLASNNSFFPEEIIIEEEIPELFPQVMPEFQGGIKALYSYIAKHIKYPKMARDNNLQGRVHISFIVEKDGSITNVNILSDVGGGCADEAARVVASMPNWKPGKQLGKKVRVQYTLPVNFKLD